MYIANIAHGQIIEDALKKWRRVGQIWLDENQVPSARMTAQFFGMFIARANETVDTVMQLPYVAGNLVHDKLVCGWITTGEDEKGTYFTGQMEVWPISRNVEAIWLKIKEQ